MIAYLWCPLDQIIGLDTWVASIRSAFGKRARPRPAQKRDLQDHKNWLAGRVIRRYDRVLGAYVYQKKEGTSWTTSHSADTSNSVPNDPG